MSGLGNKKVMGKNIERYMKLHNIDRNQLAFALGIPYTTITSWIKAENYPRIDKIEQLANYFGISKADLVEEHQPNVLPFPNAVYEPLPATKQVPFRGDIACGVPILAAEDVSEYFGMPDHIRADFCLRCKGDSMIGARIFDGDIVYIRSQPDVENGEIAAVEIDGAATLKRVYKFSVLGRLHAIEFRAENPAIEPMFYEGNDLNNIRIDGKAVYFVSMVR